MVREQDSDWHVVFSGGSGLGEGIGHARGSNLDNLVRDGDPLLAEADAGLVLLSEPASWDAVSVSAPSLIRHGDTGEWLLFYTGHADDLAGPADLPEELSIGLARSDDATTFVREQGGAVNDSRVLLPGTVGEWDSLGVAAPSVFYDNGRFQMWYQGTDGVEWQTGRATSVDGVTWERDPRNPVFDGVVDADDMPVGAFAFKASAGGYYQVDGSITGPVGEPALEGLAYESSFSPLLFQVVGGQALGRGEADTLDVDGAGGPAPATDGVVLYVGRQGSFRRMAAATDLGAGLERLGPVLLNGFEGDLSSLATADPTLPLYGIDAEPDGAGGLVVGFHTDLGISLAGGVIAPDDEAPQLTALTPGVALGPGEAGEFDAFGALSPSLVLQPGGGWRMYYEGRDDSASQIGLASSADAISWTRDGVVLERGAAGAWDDAWVAAPAVVFDGTSWHMWYAGGDGEATRIGYATSADGLAWSRHVDDGGVSVPVMEGGSLPFAEDDVSHPSVELLSDGDFEMWFEGRTGDVARIGRARSTDGVTWTPVTNPTTAGDRFTLVTREGDDSASSAIELGDDRSSPRIVDGFPVHGAGASEMILSPDGRYAIVANKRAPDLMVLDLYDDSDGDFVDSNYGDIEAVLRVPQRHGFAGMRDMQFDSEGRLWVLMAPLVLVGASSESVRYGAEGLVEIDWSLVTEGGDRAEGEFFTEGTVLRYLPLARGIEEDQGYLTEVSVGPAAMEINEAADRAYVVNYNHNSLYVLDLDAGARGNVLAIVDTLDENPWEVALSPDEKLAYVANYYGVGDVPAQHSTLQVVDVDEDSPTFGRVLTRLSNIESRSDRGCP
jgi:DNA-binding beta-propeller fold protein YncE